MCLDTFLVCRWHPLSWRHYHVGRVCMGDTWNLSCWFDDLWLLTCLIHLWALLLGFLCSLLLIFFLHLRQESLRVHWLALNQHLRRRSLVHLSEVFTFSGQSWIQILAGSSRRLLRTQIKITFPKLGRAKSSKTAASFRLRICLAGTLHSSDFIDFKSTLACGVRLGNSGDQWWFWQSCSWSLRSTALIVKVIVLLILNRRLVLLNLKCKICKSSLNLNGLGKIQIIQIFTKKRAQKIPKQNLPFSTLVSLFSSLHFSRIRSARSINSWLAFVSSIFSFVRLDGIL